MRNVVRKDLDRLANPKLKATLKQAFELRFGEHDQGISSGQIRIARLILHSEDEAPRAAKAAAYEVRHVADTFLQGELERHELAAERPRFEVAVHNRIAALRRNPLAGMPRPPAPLE